MGRLCTSCHGNLPLSSPARPWLFVFLTFREGFLLSAGREEEREEKRGEERGGSESCRDARVRQEMPTHCRTSLKVPGQELGQEQC